MIGALRRLDPLTAEWALVGLLAAALAAALVGLGLATRVDLLLYDFAQRALPRSPRSDVLLVTIDNRSIAAEGKWPWPRAREAQLIAAVAAARPKAIAVDLLLPDPGDPAGDAALTSVLAAARHGGSPVYLPLQFEVPGQGAAPYDVVLPQPRFAAAASGLGHVNLVPDVDGVIRGAAQEFAADGRSWPHLAVLLAEGAPPAPPRTAPGTEGIAPAHPLLIPFAGPQGTFAAIPATALLRGEVPAGLIAGRRVLIGVTASGLGDLYATPVGTDRSLMSGLEIQANLLNALLNGDAIRPAAPGLRLVMALLPIALMLWGLRRLRPRATLPLLVMLLGIELGAAFVLLRWGRLWIAPGGGLIALAVIYPLWSWRRLAGMSAQIRRELERFDAEHDPLERPRPDLTGADFGERQLALLRSAIDRERDLRRFLVDRIVQMPDATMIVDRTGRVVIANAAAVELWLSLGGPGRLDAAEPLLARLRIDDVPGDSAWRCEAHLPDGRSFAVASEPQRAADNSPIGAVLRFAETTEARAAEREREGVLQLLSHDMRSPQVAILTLLGDAEPGVVAEGLAARIRAAAERTLAMADGFVHLARAQSLRFEPKPVDLVDIAHEAADALWPQANAAGKRVALAVPAESEVLVAGDRSLLTRTLINLIDNALRFSEPGQAVEVAVAAEGDRAELVVSDRGAGMSEAVRARLFERFAGGPAAGLRGAGGVGLGLAFVAAAVARHDGEITCTSTPGAGTSFRLRFPLARDEAEQSS